LDGAPSVLSRLIPTAEASSLPDNGTESLSPSRSGMTCGPSTASHGKEASMSSVGDFPAPTFRQQEREQESTEPSPDCGPRWRGSLARYNHDTCSWRTRQCLLAGGLEEFSETFPRWGMMRDGELWAQSMPEHLIRETGSGLWPTPRANDYQPICWKRVRQRHRGEKKTSAGGIFNLNDIAGLWAVVHTHPHLATLSGHERHKRLGRLPVLTVPFMEILNGIPLEWTALKPLATAKFRQWLRSHGDC